MVSIGVMFVTQAIVRIIIGPFDRRFFDGEKFIIKANQFKEMTGLNEGLTIKSTQVITIFLHHNSCFNIILVFKQNENRQKYACIFR